MRPILVLTRPEAQSRAFADSLDVAARVIISPILEIRCCDDVAVLAPYAGIILTSANAVGCAPPLGNVQVHCVGEQTAAAAKAAGAEIVTIARDADDLVHRVSGTGPLLHLRGEHARGDVAERLTQRGIETSEVVVYRQVACPLSSDARQALAGDDPVVLPLFSPRSAQLVGAETHLGSSLQVLAMSAAVAKAWKQATGRDAEIANVPTGAAMRARIVAALQRDLP